MLAIFSSEDQLS
jgi:hypothetical protein